MKRTTLLSLLLGIPLALLHTTAQLAPGTGGGSTEPSPCIADAAIQVSATPAVVTHGQQTKVQWAVTTPSGCATMNVKLNGETVSETGNRMVTPGRSMSFIVIASQRHLGVFQEKSASAKVQVNYPPRVVIDPSTPDPVRVLLGALIDSTNSEQVIELCNVDLDLTGFKAIPIVDNRSLIASPACARGPRSLGPRIFVRDKRGSAALFDVTGDNVRISGFRLEGPTSDMAQGDVKEKGILVTPATADGSPIRSIEISNMEIFHWSGVGIQVVDNVDLKERGRLFNTNPGAVRVKGSFFHHNRHGAGEGYGVESSAGAYLTIEQNVFDENRHAIAGGSRNDKELDYSGYTARDNLILEGGGLHCADSGGTGSIIGGIVGGIIGGIVGGLIGGLPGAIIGGIGGAAAGAGGGYIAGTWCWQTHLIDMHGDQNEWYSSHNWQCGTAGETMIIERNTILYTKGAAIKIRGNPADKAVVDNDVFKKGSRSDAIKQNGNCGFGDNITKPIDVRPTNVFGADPMAELGSCDFFGDGQQDQFMATGVTWWAKSPVTGQWRYLNTMKEKLPELQLRKIDGDNVCDVAPKTRRPEIPPEKYSKSGTSPWIPLMVNTQ